MSNSITATRLLMGEDIHEFCNNWIHGNNHLQEQWTEFGDVPPSRRLFYQSMAVWLEGVMLNRLQQHRQLALHNNIEQEVI